MKLWLLDLGNKWDYDWVHGFVIRAETEAQARKLAASWAGDEGEAAWLRPENSTCEELLVQGDAEMLLRDVRSQ